MSEAVMRLRLIGPGVLLRMLAALVLGGSLFLHFGVAAAQSNARLAFDVASVKPTPPEGGGSYQYQFAPGGRLIIRHFRLRDLILVAWHVRDFEVEGGPEWIDKQTMTYDIDAEAAGNPTNDQMRLMLRSLLADRFRLVAHIESKVKPHYALQRNGSLGSALKPTKEGSCTPLADYGAQAPLPVAPVGATPFCGFKAHLAKLDGGGSAMVLEWQGMPIASVARTLGTELYRQVTDETNLSGNFDVRLEFRPDNFAGGSAAPGAAESTAPSIFAAVQEQLGLKLDAEKGPVEVLVIDHADPPSPN
jgi:uncharacterized protein (TIGR03435 family)